MASVENAVIICPMGDGALLELGTTHLTCPACGSIFPRKSASDFYDLRLGRPAQDRSLLVHESAPELANIAFLNVTWHRNNARLRAALNSDAPGIVLDVGCGSGADASSLDGCYSHYYGLEPSDIPPSRMAQVTPQRPVILVHNDPATPLPVAPGCVDTVMLLSSYDHIPDLGLVLPSAWAALVPGGRLLVNMTNYGFWAKRLLNSISKGQRFRHEADHYRVHSPATLIDEITACLPDALLDRTDADYWYLPRPPRAIARRLPESLVIALDASLRFVVSVVFRQRDAGSVMIIMFRKPAV